MDGNDSNDRTDEDIEREAVDDSTAEKLGAGALRDAHGELAADPYPTGDEHEPDTDVLAEHRDDAETIERRGDGPGAKAADAQGMAIEETDDPAD